MPTQKVPPQTTTSNLSKKDVIAAYGSERKVADAMRISVQAVNRWPRLIPTQRVWQALAQHPQLKDKVIEVPDRYREVKKVVTRFVKVAA